MQKIIVCNAEDVRLILDCQAIEKNLYKIIKFLNDLGLLYILPKYSEPFTDHLLSKIINKKHQKSEEELSNQPNKIKQSCLYNLSTPEAIQIIWRSAYLTKQLGIAEKQLQIIDSNMLIGRQNSLKRIIQGLKAQNDDKKSSTFIEMKKKIKRLKQIRKSINNQWENLQQSGLTQTQTQSQILQKRLNSLTALNMQENEKNICMKYIKRKIIELDIKALQKTILFIQEFQTQECLVSLEQCYPSFIVNKIQFKQIIGNFAYNMAKNRYKRAVKQAKTMKIQFTPKLFFKCHKCDKFSLNDTHNQFKRPLSFCIEKKLKADPSKSPYSYQQTIINSQYKNIIDIYGDPKPKTQSKPVQAQLFNFKQYIHPYYKPHKAKCLRYCCTECKNTEKQTHHSQQQKDIQKMRQGNSQEQTNKTDALHDKMQQLNQMLQQPNKQCDFCRKICSCQRCKIMTMMKKFIAIYQSFGGNFQQVNEELIFLNFQNKKIHLQLITFNNEQNIIASSTPPVKRGRGRPKKIRLDDKIEDKLKKQRKVRVVKSVKPWKQIIQERQQQQGQNLKENATQQNESGQQDQQQQQSIHSRQIFTGLQNLFNQILVQEQKIFNCDEDQYDSEQISQFWIKKQQEYNIKRQEPQNYNKSDEFLVKKQQKDQEEPYKNKHQNQKIESPFNDNTNMMKMNSNKQSSAGQQQQQKQYDNKQPKQQKDEGADESLDNQQYEQDDEQESQQAKQTEE